MERFAEWTFEGDLNKVGVDGNRARYPAGMYYRYVFDIVFRT